MSFVDPEQSRPTSEGSNEAEPVAAPAPILILATESSEFSANPPEVVDSEAGSNLASVQGDPRESGRVGSFFERYRRLAEQGEDHYREIVAALVEPAVLLPPTAPPADAAPTTTSDSAGDAPEIEANSDLASNSVEPTDPPPIEAQADPPPIEASPTIEPSPTMVIASAPAEPEPSPAIEPPAPALSASGLAARIDAWLAEHAETLANGAGIAGRIRAGLDFERDIDWTDEPPATAAVSRSVADASAGATELETISAQPAQSESGSAPSSAPSLPVESPPVVSSSPEAPSPETAVRAEAVLPTLESTRPAAAAVSLGNLPAFPEPPGGSAAPRKSGGESALCAASLRVETEPASERSRESSGRARKSHPEAARLKPEVIVLGFIGALAVGFGLGFVVGHRQPAPAERSIGAAVAGHIAREDAPLSIENEAPVAAATAQPANTAAVPAPSLPAGSAAPAAPARFQRPGFDSKSANVALSRAAQKAGVCIEPGEPGGTGVAAVTFDSSGHATSAIVYGQRFAGTVAGECIAGVLRGVRVPAFSGDPVSVRKTLNFD